MKNRYIQGGLALIQSSESIGISNVLFTTHKRFRFFVVVSIRIFDVEKKDILFIFIRPPSEIALAGGHFHRVVLCSKLNLGFFHFHSQFLK